MFSRKIIFRTFIKQLIYNMIKEKKNATLKNNGSLKISVKDFYQTLGMQIRQTLNGRNYTNKNFN